MNEPIHKRQSLSSPTNRLLSALTSRGYMRLMAKVERLSYSGCEIVYEQGDRIDYVYFPETAVISMIAVMDDQTSVEVATVGNEGMVGIPVFLGVDTAVVKAVIQAAGDAFRIKAHRFKAEVEQNPHLRRLVGYYAHAFLTQFARSAGCNRFHSVEQRCARWLLMTHDRAVVNQFPFTHEFLAGMVGGRRQSLTETVIAFTKAGLIRSMRGKITILNRRGLEALSCECYWSVRKEYDRA